MTDINPATDEFIAEVRKVPGVLCSDHELKLIVNTTLSRIRAETAKNSGEVAAATDGKQIVTMAEEGAWQADRIKELEEQIKNLEEQIQSIYRDHPGSWA